MKLKYLILLIICIPFLAKAQYQNLYFQDSPVSLGLNFTSIVDIAQDSRGYLWFSTYVGLYRYNGKTAKHYSYKNEESGSLSSNKVISILSTDNDELYIATLLGSLMKYNYEQDTFQLFEEKNAHILRRNLWSLHEDNNGTIWCGTEKGISLLAYQGSELRNDEAFKASNVNNKKVNFIDDAHTDYIWVGSDNGLFVFYVSQDGSIREMGHFQFEFEGYTHDQSNFISHIAKTSNRMEDKIKVFCKSGIIEFDYSNGFDQVNYRLVNPTNQDFAFPRTIVPLINQPDTYLIGTNDGNKIYNNGGLSTETFLPDVIIRALFEDQFGTVWLGTESGLYMLDQNPAQIRNIPLRNNFKYNKDLIECIRVSPKTGNLWIGWQNGQLSRIINKNGHYNFEHSDHYDVLLFNQTIHKERISYMEIDDKGIIWLATQGAGVLGIDENARIKENTIKTVVELNDQNGLIDNYIMSIEIDQHSVWIGTWKNGLIHYNKSDGKLIDVPFGKDDGKELRKAPIVRLVTYSEHGERYLGIGTGGEGVFIEKINDTPFSVESFHLHSAEDDGIRINNDFVTDLIYDAGNLYIGSENGLDIYNVGNKKLSEIKEDHEISQFIVHGIKPLEDGSIWLSTNSNGIIKVNPQDTIDAKKHYVKDVYSNYVMSPPILDSGGLLMFAGTEGLTVLNPFSNVEDQKPPIPMITGLRLNNQDVELRKKNAESEYKSISEIGHLDLDYMDKIITFELNAMHTADRQPLTYAYKLEGFNEDWVITSENENLVNFTNLPYRDYIFNFKAANSNNQWSESKSIDISISPPWWRNDLAYGLYFLGFLGFVYFVTKLFYIRQKYRHNLKLAELEKSKAEELNRLKLDFYTVISHELRTPLTMIIAPVEQLLKNQSSQKDLKSLQFIHNNAKKLLRMVNQLLDIRKLESKMVYLSLQKFDYVEFIKEIISSFKPAVLVKEITISFTHNVDSLMMAFDEDEMEKVFNNLFTNAIKYTDSGGRIDIDLAYNSINNMATVHFGDSGKGIKRKELPFIFDRYYQTEEHVHEGYGLGLSIVKSIVELHKGNISVESEIGKGTIFTMNIPTDLKPTPLNSVDIQSVSRMAEGELSGLEDSNLVEDDKISILIVEDSPDIKEFLKENLKEKYEILLAENGEEGLAMAIAKVPDLIISDIAMPKMDGLEMCKQLKNNTATSHIPVIVLTARTSMNFKLKGYEYGINAFITKPFNFELLNKQIDSTLDYLEIVKQKYHINSPGNDDHAFIPKLPEISSGDEEFVQSITDYIMENIENSDMSIEDIAVAMSMSQVQFYRKLKAITGITPKKILRQLRLQRAKQLLEQTDMNISEVTYAVGFNDLKYFRTKFKEMFDCNPSDVKKAIKVSVEQTLTKNNI